MSSSDSSSRTGSSRTAATSTASSSGAESNVYHSRISVLKHYMPSLLLLDRHFPPILTKIRVLIEFMQWAALLLIPTMGVLTIILSTQTNYQDDPVYGVPYATKTGNTVRSPSLASPQNLAGVGFAPNITSTLSTARQFYGLPGSRNVFEWGDVVSAISIPIHFTILPLWESSNPYTYIGYEGSVGYTGGTMFIIGLTFIMFAVQCLISRDSLSRRFTIAASLLFNFVTTVGFLPLLHSLLPFLVCVVGKGGVTAAMDPADPTATLAAWRQKVSLETTSLGGSYISNAFGVSGSVIGTIIQIDDITSNDIVVPVVHKCFGTSLATAMFVLALITATLLISLKLIAVLFLVEDVPTTGSILGRSHSTVEGTRLCMVVISAVLYHYLFAVGQRLTFGILIGVASFVLSILYGVMLPFYRLRTNQVHACFFIFTAFTSLVATITLTSVWQTNINAPSTASVAPTGTGARDFVAGTPSSIPDHIKQNADAIFLFVGAPVFILIAGWLTQYRVSSACLKALSLAKDGIPPMPLDLVELGLGIFPSFLPSDEIHPYRCIEAMLLNEDRFRKMRNEQLLNTHDFQQEIRQQREDQVSVPTDEYASTTGFSSAMTGTTRQDAAKEAQKSNARNTKKHKRMVARQLRLVLQKRRNRRSNAADIAAEQTVAEELAVGYPYVNAVLISTDVELATRYLHEFERATGLWPSLLMITFAVRIYTKGLAKFVRCSWLELQLVTCLCAYVPSMKHVALGIAERITNGEDVSLTVMWSAQRRVTQINAALSIHDNSTRKNFALAQQFHREALQHMKYFWGRLSHEQVDVVQLSVLAKVITDRRQEALQLYMRVLEQSSDHSSVVRYAQFLEDVMLDPESAITCRENVLDALQQEQTSADLLRNEFVEREALLGVLANDNMRNGENGHTDTTSSKLQSSDMSSSDNDRSTDPSSSHKSGKNNKSDRRNARRERVIGLNKDDTAASATRYTSIIISEKSTTIRSLNRNLNLVFLALGLVIVGLLIMLIITSQTRTKMIDKIEVASAVRTISQETASLVQQLASVQSDYYDQLIVQVANAQRTDLSIAVKTATATSVALLAAKSSRIFDLLQSNVAQLRNGITELTFGKYASSQKDVVALYAYPITQIRFNEDHRASGLVAASNSIVSGAEKYISLIRKRRENIAAASSSAATTRASATAVDFSNRNEEHAVATSIADISWTTAAVVFNESITVYITEAEGHVTRSIIGMVVLYIIVLVLVIAVYFVLVFNFRKISSTKLSTLSLFTLIPKKALESLHEESEKRVVNFDEPDAEFIKMKIARGLGDDSEAMQRLIQQTEQDLPQLLDQEPDVQVPNPNNPPASNNISSTITNGHLHRSQSSGHLRGGAANSTELGTGDSLYRAVLNNNNSSSKSKSGAASTTSNVVTDHLGAPPTGDGVWGDLFLYGNLGINFEEDLKMGIVAGGSSATGGEGVGGVGSISAEESAAVDDETWREEFMREAEEKNARRLLASKKWFCYTILSAEGCGNLLVLLSGIIFTLTAILIVIFALSNTSIIRENVSVGDKMISNLNDAISNRYNVVRFTEAFVINASDKSLAKLSTVYTKRGYHVASSELQKLAGVISSSLSRKDYFAISSLEVIRRIFEHEDQFQSVEVMLTAAGVIACTASSKYSTTSTNSTSGKNYIFFPDAYQSTISTTSAAVFCNNFPPHTWTREDFAPVVVQPLRGDAKRDNHYSLRKKLDFTYWQPFNSQDGEEHAYRSPASARKYEARYVGDDIDYDSYGAVIKQRRDNLDVRYNLIRHELPVGEATDLSLPNGTIMFRRALGVLKNPYLADNFATSITTLFGALMSIYSNMFLVMEQHELASESAAYSKIITGSILIVLSGGMIVVLKFGEEVIASGSISGTSSGGGSGASRSRGRAALRNLKRGLMSGRSRSKMSRSGGSSSTTASSLNATSANFQEGAETWGSMVYGRVLLIVIILCGAALVALGILLLFKIHTLGAAVTEMYDLKYTWATLVDMREHASLLVRQAAIYGDSTAPAQFTRITDDVKNYLARFAAFASTDAAKSAISECTTHLQSQIYIQYIAVTLGASLHGLRMPLSLERFHWNITSDAFLTRTIIQYPEQHFYSSKIEDLSKTILEKERLIIDLLYGPMMEYFWGDGYEWCINAKELSSTNLEKQYMNVVDDIDALNTGSIIVAALAWVLSFFVIVLVVRKRMAMFSSRFKSASRDDRSVKSGGSGDGGNGESDQLYNRLSRETLIGLAVLIFLFTGLLAYVIVDLGTANNDNKYEEIAATRSFNVFRSLVASQQKVANRTTLRTAALEAGESTIIAADDFYKNRVGKIESMDERIFGTIQTTLQQYSCSGDSSTTSGSTTSSAVTTTTPVYTSTDSWSTTVTTLLDEVGIDPAMRRWRDEVTALTYLTGDSASQMLAGLEKAVEPLTTAIRDTTSLHNSWLRDRSAISQIVYIVILVVTAIILLLELLFVFKPMITCLVIEEEGTNLMLKMIPAGVRDSVPAIAEYLESGVVMQDLMIHELNEAATDLSTIPTVTIDFKGRIVQFSKAAEEAFLTSKSEVLGKNVKMLMPENVSKEHDKYLLNYRRTGVKRIIGKVRQVQALKRDGNVFPAEISVREIGNGRNTYFVGTIRNIAADIQFERAMALSSAVSAAANVPVVVINGQGTILKFNRAADDLFRFDETVVGKNVNMLMPPEVAKEHNRYLSNYLNYRVKNVIDAPRIVQAKRKRGTFPVRLSVKELDRGPARDPIFIGYLEDLSKQLNLELSSMVSEAIIQTSSIPLIAIDHDGYVINWSPAAELTFGLSQEEILGQNIRVIMPDDIASKHDSFLKAYQQTGIRKIIGKTTTQRAKRRTSTGEWEYISVRISLKDIPGPTPYTNKFVAYLEDVTSSVELEREYRISASTTRLSSIPLITINAEGIVYSFSAAAEDTFGFREQEVVGKNVKMLMPDHIAEKHDGYLKNYSQTGERRYVDISRLVTARHKDGTVFPAELTIHTVEVNGQFLIVGFLRNVADDVELMQSNAYNTAISALAATPLIWIDTRGVILGCSESTVERFQWSREELMGQNINILMPDHYAQSHDKHLEAYARRMKTDGAAEAARKSKILGKERYVMAKTRDERTFPACVLVKDIHVDGSMPIFVGYIRDLTYEIQLAVQKSMATTIIQSSFVPIVCIDRAGIISEFSAAAERDLGYTREEVMGKNVKILMPQDVALQHDGFLKAYAKTGIKNILDNRRSVVAVKKDGTQFYAELMVKEIIRADALGKEVVEYIGFIRDLSQHYVLSQANHINEVVAQLSTVPIIIITSKGQILEANNAAEQDFGYSISEMVGSNIKMLMPQYIATKHDGYLARYAATGVKHVIDRIRLTTGQRKNGQLFPVELSVKEVRKDGASSQFIGYCRDATLQQEINMAHQINSTIIELSATPLLVIDHMGSVEVFSRAAEETFGYEKSEVLGQNLKMLMPQEVADKHDEYLRMYLETGIESVIGTSRRVQAKRKNGTLFPGELSVRKVIKEETKNPIYIGYLRDLTEDIRMEALNAFSATAHELSPVPVIVIDHLGVIVRFSASAEQEFRVAACDIIGKNISSLQPQDVASQHDEYLRRYLTTGQRHIIGSQRIVSARRLDGTVFRAQLTVQEVRRRKPEGSLVEDAWAQEHNFMEGDDKPNFVGYLRNIEQDIKVEELSREGIAMMDLAPLPVVVCSQLGIILRVNAAVETVFGYSSETITGTNVKVLMPESIAREHDGYLKKFDETGIRNVINRTRLTTGRREDGTTFPMEISVRELVVQGIEKQYVAYLRDMTPLQRAKEAAMLNEAVVSLASTPLIAITPKGAIIRFTEQAEKLFGYAANEVLGKNVKLIMPDEIAAKHDSYLSNYQRKRVKSIIDSRRVVTGVHKNGTHFPCEFGVREILEEGTTDKTQAFVGYIRDLKEGEFAVEGSSEINALMMDLSLHGVIIMSTDGIVERANDAVTSMFGIANKSDFIGQNIKYIMPSEIADRHDEYLATYLETGIKHVIDTRRVTTARNVVTNESFPVEISVKELQELGKPTKYVGYVRLVAHELQVAQARRLNNAALDLSPSGMIVIDSSGTIMMFSRVAEELFECSAADIVGLNVNVLMPAAVAARHDDHLGAYRVTREKHVIDSQQTLLGKKFNRNELFTISLLVRELQFTSVPGMDSCFVGYVAYGNGGAGALQSISGGPKGVAAAVPSGGKAHSSRLGGGVGSLAMSPGGHQASSSSANYNDPMSAALLNLNPRNLHDETDVGGGEKKVKKSKRDKGDKKSKEKKPKRSKE